MKVKYVELRDKENPQNPKGEVIACELQIEIDKMEHERDFEFISACFLGEDNVPEEGEDDIFMHAVVHDKVHKYMLFFK